MKAALAKLRLEVVKRAVRKHLRTADLVIAAAVRNAEELPRRLLAGEPSPISSNAPRPPEVLEEDKIVASWKLELKPENIRVVSVEKIFEQPGARASEFGAQSRNPHSGR